MLVNKEQWSRSKSVNFPQIWRKCSGLKRMENGKVPKFTIQDIPEDMHEDIIDFMTTHFCRDEVICMSVGFLQDPVSTLELQNLWRELMKQNMALVAFVEDEEDGHRNTIAGCNITCVTTKDEKITFEKFKGRCMRTVMKHAMDKATELANVFERYGVQEYMTAVGLCVDPVFRGQGLGLEILKARFDLCKAVDLKVTMTVFTGIASQLLAHRVGMEVIAEVVYEDCKEDGKPAFPNIKCKSAKVMAKRVE